MSENFQAPIEELLESVPKDWHIEVELGLCHWRHIPVGKHCWDAAREIRRLREQLSRLRNHVCWLGKSATNTDTLVMMESATLISKLKKEIECLQNEKAILGDAQDMLKRSRNKLDRIKDVISEP